MLLLPSLMSVLCGLAVWGASILLEAAWVQFMLLL
jgi:hypothetical protein